ncbi:MAG: helix-turn-helix domain-containing protein [Bacteroidetes bacterium]|jgi:hypothetical protein|nr:helix-turn-helix domain-containing protein [Bacteroidota bacterium]
MSNRTDLPTILAGLEPSGLQRLQARLALLHAYLRTRDAEGLSDRQALEQVAAQFNAGAAAVDDWVYGVYDSVSGRTLRRWAERLQEGGLAGLTDDYGKRSERTYRSYFDPGSPLRKVALHHLADHPDCTASEVMAELRQHADGGDLPNLRTVQRFLEKFRA